MVKFLDTALANWRVHLRATFIIIKERFLWIQIWNTLEFNLWVIEGVWHVISHPLSHHDGDDDWQKECHVIGDFNLKSHSHVE